MFRFTIRDVLWLMVVVAVLCAWWVDRYGIINERKALAVERQLLKSDQEALRAKVRRVDKNLSNRILELHAFEGELLARMKRNVPLTDADLAQGWRTYSRINRGTRIVGAWFDCCRVLSPRIVETRGKTNRHSIRCLSKSAGLKNHDRVTLLLEMT